MVHKTLYMQNDLQTDCGGQEIGFNGPHILNIFFQIWAL